MIEFTQNFTAQEVREQVELWYKAFIGKQMYLWLGVGFIGFGCYLVIRDGISLNQPGIFLLGCSVIYLIYIGVIRRRMTVAQVYSSLKNSAEFGQQTEVKITDAGTIKTSCNGESHEHKLSAFLMAIETETELILFVRKSGWIALKRSGFTAEEYKVFRHNVDVNRIKVIVNSK